MSVYCGAQAQRLGVKTHHTSNAKVGQYLAARSLEVPPTGPYTTLNALADALSTQLQYDTLIQLMVLQDLLTINGAVLKIQNNKQSGEQALAVRLPAVPANLPPEDDTNDLFTTVLEQITASREEGERESFFAQVLRELGGPDSAPVVNSPVDAGESETLAVPPPSLRDRLAALDAPDWDAAQEKRDREANARYASGSYEPDNHKQPETLIVPPPGFRERLVAFARSGDEIEVVKPNDETETRIVPPPEMQRRYRAAPHDIESSEPAESEEDDTSHETGEQ
jgi:hypothetical protein